MRVYLLEEPGRETFLLGGGADAAELTHEAGIEAGSVEI